MENNCFNGLTTVNIELTSRCNKQCWMCGRRKLEKQHPELCNWGDMDYLLFLEVVKQFPSGIVVQLHSNGEPTLYPFIGEAIRELKYKGSIVSFNTNAKLLMKEGLSHINSKYEFTTIGKELIDNLDTLCISVIENDPEGDEQYEIVKKFIEIKGDRKPFIIYRLLGDVGWISSDNSMPHYILTGEERKMQIKREQRWYKLPGIVATRILHNPMGSFNYIKKVTIPEMGICLDLLSHMVINVDGTVSLCIRFDPLKELIIGDIKKEKLIDIWNGKKRLEILQKHIDGKRNELLYCGKKCDYYGIPCGE